MEDGIIVGVYKKDLVYIDLKIAQQLVRERKEIGNGKTYPILADVRSIKRIDPEAKAYFASDEATALGSACAIVVKNVFSILLGNFYVKVSPPKEPLKLFTNREMAFDWLKQFRFLS